MPTIKKLKFELSWPPSTSTTSLANDSDMTILKIEVNGKPELEQWAYPLTQAIEISKLIEKMIMRKNDPNTAESD
jgi:hypothetical protein